MPGLVKASQISSVLCVWSQVIELLEAQKLILVILPAAILPIKHQLPQITVAPRDGEGHFTRVYWLEVLNLLAWRLLMQNAVAVQRWTWAFTFWNILLAPLDPRWRNYPFGEHQSFIQGLSSFLSTEMPSLSGCGPPHLPLCKCTCTHPLRGHYHPSPSCQQHAMLCKHPVPGKTALNQFIKKNIKTELCFSPRLVGKGNSLPR